MANIRKEDVVVDLGCGDGRILVTAAKKYGCKAVGYDIDEDCVQLARENVKKNQVEKLVQIAIGVTSARTCIAWRGVLVS